MFGWLRNLIAPRAKRPAAVRATYDVAQTTDSNTRHWANADGLSARIANSPEVRKTIRDRSRYEILENNCYAKGIVLTLANDTIGTGPRLQLRTESAEVNAKTEAQLNAWMKECGLAEKLRMMRVAKGVDGEIFAHFTSNERLRHPVKLGLAVSEADHFCSPLTKSFDERIDDGIEYDKAGNPIWYYRQQSHPGGDFNFVNPLDYERLPAEQVIHLFRKDRPGQTRGISEFVTALSIYAQLRGWTQAELDAAKFAASLNAVIQTTGSAVAEPDDVDALDAIPYERNGLLTMPKGWGANQLKSEHPNAQSESFERRRVREIARCVNMPLIIALGDSTDANYSSGRLDHQTYFKSIWVERSYWECACLDRIFLAWLQEAALIPGYLPDELKEFARAGQLPPHEWFWDGFQHVDPEKEANALTSRLSVGNSSRAAEYAKEGKDVDSEDQRAAESLGVTIEEYRRAIFNKLFQVAINDPEVTAQRQAAGAVTNSDVDATADLAVRLSEENTRAIQAVSSRPAPVIPAAAPVNLTLGAPLDNSPVVHLTLPESIAVSRDAVTTETQIEHDARGLLSSMTDTETAADGKKTVYQTTFIKDSKGKIIAKQRRPLEPAT